MKSLEITLFFCAALVILPANMGQAGTSLINNLLCAPAKQMREKLERQFGATQAGQGWQSPEQIMELWQEPAGEWTLVIAYASGTSCIVAMGEHWASFGIETRG